jgi:hypothetical protein
VAWRGCFEEEHTVSNPTFDERVEAHRERLFAIYRRPGVAPTLEAAAEAAGKDARFHAIADMLERYSTVCRWTHDDPERSVWTTSCGHAWQMLDGTPAENGMRFCCYCGGGLNTATGDKP